MMFSHRVLRYFTPLLHLLALAANVALVADRATALYVSTLSLQAALLLAALLGGVLGARPLLLARRIRAIPDLRMADRGWVHQYWPLCSQYSRVKPAPFHHSENRIRFHP